MDSPHLNYAEKVYETVLRKHEINGAIFKGISLQVGDYEDKYDPKAIIIPSALFTAWAISNKNDGFSFQRYDYGEEASKLIQKADLGKLALSNFEQQRQVPGRGWSINEYGNARDFCRRLKIPYGIIMTGIVEESNEIEHGSKIATLYFPLLVSPRLSLRLIKNAIANQNQANIAS